MSGRCNTVQNRKVNDQSDENSLLGSFYRLKSHRKFEKSRKKVNNKEVNLCENDTENNSAEINIYTTPVRSSRRINRSKSVQNDDSESLFECSSKGKDNKVVFTPNPYINDDVINELLNDLLIKYKNKIQIINLKLPQVDIDEIDNLEELNNKLFICDDNDDNNIDTEKTARQEEKIGGNSEKKDYNGGDIELENNTKYVSLPSVERKKYFISRNKPRVIIGGKNQSHFSKDYKVIAENKYWMVIEFHENSYLRKKHSCSRILTKKGIIERHGSNKQHISLEDSIQEYKTLHSELKQLLELSNYCYSPDIY
ncbi:hypothetical protein RS030_6759 [Cryptosporidium xiaoi]|uniref:Uncharacterized protein n=1 Tax=Cryptosporidium xiaoi TaxID=659607 RepID=A0AAV9XUK6_9CRYT